MEDARKENNTLATVFMFFGSLFFITGCLLISTYNFAHPLQVQCVVAPPDLSKPMVFPRQ